MPAREFYLDPGTKRKRLQLAVLFLLLYLLIPLGAMEIKTYDRETCINRGHCYEFDVRIDKLLDNSIITFENESTVVGGYYLVEAKNGGPSDMFVLYIPNHVTEDPPDELIGYGSRMDRNTFFGPQYIFYPNYVEIYLKEIKNSIFWTEEMRDLNWMYLTPVNPFYPLISFLTATLVLDSGFNPIIQPFVSLLSLFTFGFQVVSISRFTKAIYHKKYTMDQIAFFISRYFLTCVLLILPLIPIENADPF